jgi:hypothetical protein
MGRKPKASEHQEQVTLFRWVEIQQAAVPELALLHAIPNGGHRSKVAGAKMKAEGVKPGVPDICLPVPKGKWHGLYIEMKTCTGTTSEEQRWWLAQLQRQGYRVAICRSWKAARDFIMDYLKQEAGYGSSKAA